MDCPRRVQPLGRHPELFETIGYVYGGNGQTLFALPDLRARAVVGAGQGDGLARFAIGQSAGADEVPIESVQVDTRDGTNVTVNSVTRGTRNMFSSPSRSLHHLRQRYPTVATRLRRLSAHQFIRRRRRAVRCRRR